MPSGHLLGFAKAPSGPKASALGVGAEQEPGDKTLQTVLEASGLCSWTVGTQWEASRNTMGGQQHIIPAQAALCVRGSLLWH
jgi:hypothetical protein